MKRLLMLVVLLLSFRSAMSAQGPADPLTTGNDFIRQCVEPKHRGNFEFAAAQYMRCMGYIQGFLEAQTTLAVVSAAKVPYCYPENVDFGQVRRVVMKFLNDNPDKTHLPVSVLMEKALIDAFPCNK